MLEIVGLEKTFGTARALRRVDLKIPDGEFFSLLGPSGCGKTTLLRLLGGFESPSAGEIRQGGRRIDVLPPNERQFNMVFQRYALFPHLNVFENVAFGLRMKKVPTQEIRSRVEEMLGLVKMTGFGGRSVATLSGGQQQRIALARALVNRPRVLLLDEPLSALDLKLRQQMQVELKSIQRRLGHTFIFVTHDQEEALTLSDRIAVMNEGVIEQVGAPEEIYENPRTEFVARFIGSINSWDGEVLSQGAEGSVIRLPEGSPLALLQIRPAHGPAPEGLRPGSRVRVLLRPEKIRISPRGAGAGAVPGCENRLEGVLRQVLFQGAATQYVVDCSRGELSATPALLVSQPNTDLGARRELKAGDPVVLSWAASDCLLMTEEPAA